MLPDGQLIKCCLILCKELPEVKAIVKGVEGIGILVTRAKVSLQTTGLATQLLEIKDQYDCLVKLIETMESGKHHQRSGASNPGTCIRKRHF